MISIKNLSKSYKQGSPVFESLDLEIPSGGVHGLVGPNGAGKTTLISILNGILDWESGSIQVQGLDLRSKKKEILERSSLVPQNHAFYNKLTVQENIYFFANLLNLSRVTRISRIQQAIEIATLDQILHSRASRLSGGQKRRLNLAIGLLSEPEILYLDEPTVGIDPRSRQGILESIQQVAKTGITIIFASHYLEEVEEISETVAVLDRGRIQYIQNSNDPEGSEKRRLLIHFQTPEPVDPALHSEQNEIKRIGPNSYSLFIKDIPEDQIHRSIDEIRMKKYQITSIRYGKKSLNEIYHEIVSQQNGELR